MAQGKLVIFPLLLQTLMVVLWGCAQTEIKREIVIPEEFKQTVREHHEIKTTPDVPDYQPVTEDLSGIKNKVIDIVARSTPLKDVVHVIAEATGLNLFFESDVNIETPVTLTLKNTNAIEALDTIFDSLDYFYTIKNNMLHVSSLATKIIELGRPLIVQSYSTDMGGDILGGALSTSGGGGAGAGGGGAGGSTSLRGTITQGLKSDPKAFNFWDNIESSLRAILGIGGEATGLGTQSSLPVATGGTPSPQPALPVDTGRTPSPQPTLPRPIPTQPQGIASPSGASQNTLVVDRATGTILITATKKKLKLAEEFLNRVKRGLNRQIVVEAKIIEVALTDRLRYGIDWEAVLRTARNTEITIATEGFRNVVPSNAGLPSLNIGVIRGTNIGTFLRALSEFGDFRTLSNPRINILNGQTALLVVGRNLNFISRVRSTITQGNPPIVERSVDVSSLLSGIMLGLNPYIDENGDIIMNISPIITDLVSLDESTVGSGSDAVLLKLPIVDLKQLSTMVKARDGETIVIGGLIIKKESFQQDKVPLIGDIPIAGEAFKSKDRGESRTEMVILLRSHIVSR